MTPITLSRQRHGLLVDCLADRIEPVARSPRFAVYDLHADQPDRQAALDLDDVILVHDFVPSEIDNNIGGYVANELLPLLAGSSRSDASEQDVFERFVGEIVRSMDGSERRAWHLFYDNTLAALQGQGGANGGSPVPQDFIADFAAIYRRVAALADEVSPDTILDVATCFGYLPLLLADQTEGAEGPRSIVGCDLNTALVALATDYARERRLTRARFVVADILAADLGQSLAPSFDVVTAIHLLEHLEPAETAPALDALWSLTRRRLIVAVPIEAIPDARFGHRQVFDVESLGVLGRRLDGVCRSFDDHGAWLVVDRARDRGSDEEGMA